MRPHSFRLRSPRSQRGMTMIELLVSFVIFTFGMLGLAGLQTRTLSLNQSGLYRSQATTLTADVLEQMRSSVILARAGKWNTTEGATSETISVSGGGIADKALKLWKQDVEAQLPAGMASITVSASASGVSNLVTIVISWDDTRGREAARQSFTTLSRL